MISDSSNNWFVCPQANPGAETRLFLFPYAGGGPAAFGQWPAALPGTIETRIAHYPGRGSRHKEAPIKQISTLVESLSQAIRPLLDKPFAFFGHSLGGLVAFELARQLRLQSLPQPQILFVSACGAPGMPDPHPPIHTLGDPAFLGALQDLNGIPAEVMKVPELIELLLPTLRADFAAVENYKHRPHELSLDGPITAFGGRDDPRVSSERLEGWALHTNSGFKAQYFPGDHFFINTTRETVIATITDQLISARAKIDPKTTWSHPPDSLELEPDQVDVWRIPLDFPTVSVKSMESILSGDESEHAARFRFPEGKDRYIIAHGCLRAILARYLCCEPDQLTFSNNEYGKPALNGHDLEFNLSHSGDFALVAVSQGRKVGVDVERIRSDMELERIAGRYFSKSEVTELMALAPEQRAAGFFNGWARKEAYIKACGLGLSLPLDSFDVSLAPGMPAILHATRPDEQEAARWRLLSLEVAPGYAAAVAAEGAVLSLPKGAVLSLPAPVERSGPGSKEKNLEFRLWDWTR